MLRVLARRLAQARGSVLTSSTSSTTWKARPTQPNASSERIASAPGVSAAIAPKQNRRADKRAGLEAVHGFELRASQRLADAARSMAWPPPCPRAARQRQTTNQRGRCAGPAPRDVKAKAWLQCIADQQCRRFAKCHVEGGLAAAQHVVVHARHVVVNERIHVDHLHAAAAAVEALRLGVGQLAGRVGKQRADALAAAQTA